MTDNEAILRCQDGDRDAFRYLVEQYKDVLFGTAVLMTGNRAVAEEQVQEALLSAWRGIRGFRRGNPVKPWLMRILVNAVLAQQRRRTIETVRFNGNGQEEPDYDNPNPAETLDALENRLELRRAIAGLSPDHRRVVALRYFAGLTVPEVARALGVREGTVKSRLHRALAILRQQLEESGLETPTPSGRSSTGSEGG
ncbi:MAG: RNA polymerase sigma factor [Chloroflexi bacterium]|nr:RNA polymerase sigma factor [Chloroflexota bacterium]MYE39220.1 RNA polymerase sigma factor [Chloroflexota bacterium]